MVTCTGHIGIHEGADGRTYGRTLYGRHGYKTKFSPIDGLPYFLNYGAPRVGAFGARGAPLLLCRLPTAFSVSLIFNKSSLFNAAFSTSAKEHKSPIFSLFITRWFNAFSFFSLFHAI